MEYESGSLGPAPGLAGGMRLVMEGWSSLMCQVSPSHMQSRGIHFISKAYEIDLYSLQNVRKLSDNKIDSSFHLLPALQTEEFHDFVIRSRSGKEFPVHKTILSAEKINTDERYLESVFFGFSDEVTGALLHYIYSQAGLNGLQNKEKLWIEN